MSTLSSDLFRKNKGTFLEFPKEYTPLLKDQIKIFEEELVITNSADTWAGQKGTQLPKTLKVIQSIVEASLTSFSEAINSCNPLDSRCRNLQLAWEDSIEVLSALLFFAKIYLQRYKDVSHDGVEELRQFRKETVQKWVSMALNTPEDFHPPAEAFFLKSTQDVSETEISCLAKFYRNEELNLTVSSVSGGELIYDTPYNAMYRTFWGKGWSLSTVQKIKDIALRVLRRAKENSPQVDTEKVMQLCKQIYLSLTLFRGLYTLQKKNPDAIRQLELLHEDCFGHWRALHQTKKSLPELFQYFRSGSLKDEENKDHDMSDSIISLPSKVREIMEMDTPYIEPGSTQNPAEDEQTSVRIQNLIGTFDTFTNLVLRNQVQYVRENPETFAQVKQQMQCYLDIAEIKSSVGRHYRTQKYYIDKIALLFLDQFALYSSAEQLSGLAYRATKRFWESHKIELAKKTGAKKLFDTGVSLKFLAGTMARTTKFLNTVHATHLFFRKWTPNFLQQGMMCVGFHYPYFAAISLIQHSLNAATDISFVLENIKKAKSEAKKNRNVPVVSQIFAQPIYDKTKVFSVNLRKDVTKAVTEFALSNLIYVAIYLVLSRIISRGLEAGALYGCKELVGHSQEEAERETALFMALLWYGCWGPFLLGAAYMAKPAVQQLYNSYQSDFTIDRTSLAKVFTAPLVDQFLRKIKQE
jgi:hypothetical protein